MIYENKKLAISGIAGVLVASLIISSVVMAPWSTLDAILGFPKMPPDWPSGPLDVQMFVSNLTEPLGVGSEGEVTVVVTSTRNISDVVIEVYLKHASSEWPTGISFISQNITITKIIWNGDLRANVSWILTQRIEALEVGYAQIVTNATWSPSASEGFHYWQIGRVWVLILEDDIRVSQEWISLPGFNMTESVPLPP